jgi:hypothetical protein
MPIKIQYPVNLGEGTKCPSCNLGINPMGGNIYVCQAGHVIEAILLVTMRPKKAQQSVSVRNPITEPPLTDTGGPLTPSYETKPTKNASANKNVSTDTPLLPPKDHKDKIQ